MPHSSYSIFISLDLFLCQLLIFLHDEMAVHSPAHLFSTGAETLSFVQSWGSVTLVGLQASECWP